eukprot:3506033-Amphidinium_carterae.3
MSRRCASRYSKSERVSLKIDIQNAKLTGIVHITGAVKEFLESQEGSHAEALVNRRFTQL